jgi:peptide deformylase
VANIDVAGTADSGEPQPDTADHETRPAKTGKHLWGHTNRPGFAGRTGKTVAMPSDDVLPIVMCGDAVLRQPAQNVDPSDLAKPAMRRLIAQMRATMEAAPGVGLAAPQVGVPLRLAVLQDGPERWGQQSADELAMRERTPLPFTVMVNPVLSPLEDGGDATFYEGCLSVPGLTGVVRRHRSVRVEALDEHGKAFSREYRGWPARIAQHELDHLAGVLYLDRVETRSISTGDNYAKYWAGPTRKAAQALGFQA